MSVKIDSFWFLLESVARRSNFTPTLDQWQEMWPTFCSAPFDRVSTPCALAKGVLYIEVKSTSWLKEFATRVPEIEAKIKRLPWGVHKIELFDPASPDLRSSQTSLAKLSAELPPLSRQADRPRPTNRVKKTPPIQTSALDPSTQISLEERLERVKSLLVRSPDE